MNMMGMGIKGQTMNKKVLDVRISIGHLADRAEFEHQYIK